MTRIGLNPVEFNRIRQELQDREKAIIEQVLQRPDYPPLPPCPECGAVVDRIDSMTEVPQFGVDEQAILINIQPCGHQFRTAVDLDAAL